MSDNPSMLTPFTLRAFYRAARVPLQLEVVVEAGMDHDVPEPMMHRPGLALTGFFPCFAWKRIQVIGKAEKAYLMSLDAAERVRRMRALFDHGAYCVVYACGMPVTDEVQALAREAGIAVFSTKMLTRHFIHAGTFVLERLSAPKTKLYATTVEVAGVGVMMRGDPGLGKSETALGLIKHGNALVADDLTCLRRDADGLVYASASGATCNFMEIRGIGIIDVTRVFGVSSVRGEKQLDLVITFRRMEDVNGELDRTGEELRTTDILGAPVPEIVIPVSAGRDLVNLVETAAQQFKLKCAGFDPAKMLDERLKERAVRNEGNA